MGAEILHVDLDAFYASVEQLLDPALRGRPVAVGGGVVLAASYEARAFGVRSGMSGSVAARLCPGLVFVGGHFDRYLELSDEIFDLCRDVTPIVEQISIDEAFLDVSGATHLFGTPTEIGAGLRARVRERTELALSVGVARTKFLAKIASQVAKPDGLVHVPPEDELDFLHPLPVRLMWGVGPVIGRRLAEVGISTIGELAASRPEALRALVGPAAAGHLSALARNHDPRRVQRERRAGSVGAQSAFPRSRPDLAALSSVTHRLADRIGGRLRTTHRSGRTVTIRVRIAGGRTLSRSRTTRMPIATTAAIHRIAVDLVAKALGALDGGDDVNLVGISVSGLEVGAPIQLELPYEGRDEHAVVRSGSEAAERRSRLDGSVDEIRRRFGRKAVGFAGAAATHEGVPDAFRRLAQRDERAARSRKSSV